MGLSPLNPPADGLWTVVVPGLGMCFVERVNESGSLVVTAPDGQTWLVARDFAGSYVAQCAADA